MFPYICIVMGLITGSFLNVVIRRYPVMLRQQIAEFQGETQNVPPGINLIRPRSHCPHCRKSIRIRDNIPLISWLILKGRCSDCHGKISLRYPLVELLTALSFLLAGIVWPDSGWGVAVMILSAWLIAASFIDLEHQWLPDIFTQGVLWTGLIVAWGGLSPLPLHDAVSGGLAGFVSFLYSPVAGRCCPAQGSAGYGRRFVVYRPGELDRSFVTAGCGARGVILCSDICHHDREICKYSAFRPLSESGRNGDVIYRH